MYASRFALVPRLATVSLLVLGLLSAGAHAQFDFSGFGGGLDESEVTLTGKFIPATDDAPAQLAITAEISDGFHIYAVDQGQLPDDGGGPLATTIEVESGSGVKLLGPWKASVAPKTHIDHEIWEGLEIREHLGRVTWTAPVEIAADGGSVANILIEAQACDPHTCIPIEESLQIALGSGPATSDGAAATPFLKSPAKSGAESLKAGSASAYDPAKIVLGEKEEKSIIYYLVVAFLGGIVLNIMPCVLPVIGLKVMSFVQQAGQSRSQALLLNIWYSAGIISVFLVLASLALSLSLKWGDQFSSAGFNLTLIGIVFAFALSLLGVWEIPIPGFVGGGTAMKAAEREGALAAFLKGVLTTLLATPCTGPLMGAAMLWALNQPAWITFSVFGTLGLGMASPYLLIGAFPKLVNFLPKPGPWMETFKQISGFVLLATVVWLMSVIEMHLLVPTALMLIGIAIACWWVSRTPITAAGIQKVYAWTTAGLITLISIMGSYGILHPIMLERFEKQVSSYSREEVKGKIQEFAVELGSVDSLDTLREKLADFENVSAQDTGEPWQPFNLEKLGRVALNEGRTVMVDFTADWCVNCKTLEQTVLKTEEVEKEIAKSGVVTMEADYTHRPPELRAMLDALGAAGVPVIAIFPASNPYRPIVFKEGVYTQEGLIEGIAQAIGDDSRNPEADRTSLSQAAEIAPRF